MRENCANFSRPRISVGIIIMLGIFAAWAIPYLQATSSGTVGHVWTRQFSGRLFGEDFNFHGWILNIPRGLGYFLPWILLLPFAHRAEFANENDRRLARGLGWGITISFLVISLIPGSLPRYTMPLIAPMCWLMATLLCAERFDLPAWLRFNRPQFVRPKLRLPLLLALIAAFAMCTYAIVLVPRLQHRQKIRNIAERINALVPPAATLYAVDPDYQPFLFYVKRPLRYVDTVEELAGGYTLFSCPIGKRNGGESTLHNFQRDGRNRFCASTIIGTGDRFYLPCRLSSNHQGAAVFNRRIVWSALWKAPLLDVAVEE